MKHIPTRKLADVLFRGKADEHSFRVYPITADITDQAAVFIISRRVVDNFGKGHHVVVCIGDTNSTLAELKKHKRSKCVKDHAANVVCLLKEKDADARAAVIADLVSNRRFSCVRNVYKPKIEPIRKRTAATKKKPDSNLSNAKRRTVNSAAKSSRASAARAGKAKAGARVQSSVDRDGRQHRLSDSKGPAARKAKGGVARVSRAGKKAAA